MILAPDQTLVISACSGLGDPPSGRHTEYSAATHVELDPRAADKLAKARLTLPWATLRNRFAV